MGVIKMTDTNNDKDTFLLKLNKVFANGKMTYNDRHELQQLHDTEVLELKMEKQPPTYCKGCSFKCQATECECICHNKMRKYWEKQELKKKYKVVFHMEAPIKTKDIKTKTKILEAISNKMEYLIFATGDLVQDEKNKKELDSYYTIEEVKE